MVEILIKKFIEQDKAGMVIAAQYGPFSFSELMILIELSRTERMTTQEILKHFQLERGILGTLLNRLTAQNLIGKEKDSEDRRKTYYVLTEIGHECIQAAMQSESEIFEFVMMDMSINEQKAILKFLSRINQLTVEKYSDL